MSFALSLSGLTGASRALDVISNNIANADTIGFKASKARFADVLAASSVGSSRDTMSAGVAGVSAEIIEQQLTQGNTSGSNNPLDMAINGLGFFRLEKDNEITYTRDGQFQLGYDAANPNKFFLINQSGRNVTGYNAEYTVDPQGVIVPSSKPVAIAIEPSMPAAASTAVTLGVNFDARAIPPTATPFDPTDARTYNSTTAVKVFDATGIKHDLVLYFVKPAAGNLWQMYSTADGGAAVGPSSLQFDVNGKLAAGSTLPPQTYTLPSGATLSSISFDMSGATQYGVPFSVDSMEVDGYAAGTVDSGETFSVGADGVISARYSNGQARRVGQVVLANFFNPNALLNIGNGQWIVNTDPVKGTGNEILDTPGRLTGDKPQGMGTLQGNARELSNVDLSTELVTMIEQQRNYQASAQTFKILDQVMQNLVNLQR